MSAGTLLALIPIVGVVAGMTRVFSSRAPFIVAGLVVLLYGLYMVSGGIWAATCWDCRSMSESRGEVFFVSAVLFGLLALTTLLGIWLGARLVTVLQRLRRTWREIRGESDPPAADGQGV